MCRVHVFVREYVNRRPVGDVSGAELIANARCDLYDTSTHSHGRFKDDVRRDVCIHDRCKF